MAGGKWLLVEGIDSAPPEVLAALAPLLDGRALHLSHRAQVITAGPGFQFLATITSAPGAAAVANWQDAWFSSIGPTPGPLPKQGPIARESSIPCRLRAYETSTPAGGGSGTCSSGQAVHDMLGGLLATVTVEAPPPAEQLEILESLFPALAPLLRHALAMQAIVQGSPAQADE